MGLVRTVMDCWGEQGFGVKALTALFGAVGADLQDIAQACDSSRSSRIGFQRVGQNAEPLASMQDLP
jgi:hypothetical protein